jgi:hypothetical protein
MIYKKTINSVFKMHEWKSVLDYLPNNDQSVLALMENGYIKMVHHLEDGRFLDMWECNLEGNVSHWVNIPPAPKKSSLAELREVLLEPFGFKISYSKIDVDKLIPYREITHDSYPGKIYNFNIETLQDLSVTTPSFNSLSFIKNELEKTFGFKLTETRLVIKAAMKEASKEVRAPKCVRDGKVKPTKDSDEQ